MNKEELEIEHSVQSKLWISSFSLSIILHIIIIITFIYVSVLQEKSPKVNSSFFTLNTEEFIKSYSEPEEPLIENNKHEQNVSEESKPLNENEISAVSFDDIILDTTNLDQVYSESTLNISIKYPKGWTYVDQNNKSKLDGVTFWATDDEFKPPPYIHLEVVDKNYFIEKRFAYKLELKKYHAYYNDEEIMQGYITQIVYIRTDEDSDFKLKLMIKGEEEFKLFQPKFWAILKSFDFRTSLF
ncbi:MAG: hypothetical protein WAU11_16890 [Ignavibacteriaceae bacterium]